MKWQQNAILAAIFNLPFHLTDNFIPLNCHAFGQEKLLHGAGEDKKTLSRLNETLHDISDKMEQNCKEIF